MGEFWVRPSNGGAAVRQESGLTWESSAPPDPASLREECLSAAEEAAQQVLNCLHPTLDSEEKRRDIIDYIQRLIKKHLNCEVFPYGSVPLKTYLPDGDIDLTAFSGTNADESLARDVFALLQKEGNFAYAEFKVQDTQYIDAEVKLVKCLVQNLIIDISFNQLGGLSTLCFLEQVDRLVGRNHLFKRSIILIKAWCYYESRILGAHHGLISTYALETLVLYIFHLYNSSLRGPLTVLYRFLEYYSEFDWENYCISLKGPVCKSSLPDIVVKVPEKGSNDLMFGQEFLENCMEMFSVSSRGLEGKPKAFQPKHLNIIDPLKENNNLGRSVHKGNFYRIRSAFKYGARKLGQVLSLPFDKVADEIHKFFSNAIARHGNDNRNFIQNLSLEFDDEESSTVSLSCPVNMISEENMLLRSYANNTDGIDFESKNGKKFPLKTSSDGRYPTGVNLGQNIAVDTYDVIISNTRLRNGSLYHTPHTSYSTSHSWNNYLGPLCFISKLPAETGNFLKGDQVDFSSQKCGFKSCLEDSNEHMEVNYKCCTTDLGNVDDMCLRYKDLEIASTGESEAFNPLADLTGDYDSHIRSLLYGQLCQGFCLAAVVHHPPVLPSRTNNKKPCHIVHRSMPCWWSQFSQMTVQPVPTKQSNCRAADVAPPAYGFCSESQKPRVNGQRHPLGRSRNKVSGCCDQFNRHEQSNGVYVASGVQDKANNRHGEKGSRYQHRRGLNAKCPSPRSVGNENQTNDDSCGSWRIEFGSIGNLAHEVISCSAAETDQGSTVVQERFAGKPVHLKNEAEFPPLC